MTLNHRKLDSYLVNLRIWMILKLVSYLTKVSTFTLEIENLKHEGLIFLLTFLILSWDSETHSHIFYQLCFPPYLSARGSHGTPWGSQIASIRLKIGNWRVFLPISIQQKVSSKCAKNVGSPIKNYLYICHWPY